MHDLLQERQLREEESTCHTMRISELAYEKEKERQLELELTYLKRLLQNERQKALTAQEQVLPICLDIFKLIALNTIFTPLVPEQLSRAEVQVKD